MSRKYSVIITNIRYGHPQQLGVFVSQFNRPEVRIKEHRKVTKCYTTH
uniref:Uncharacterized protein n=1 Tax=Anguilla anguilla TaxID=7936 RepID=A0A0E9RT12_ANGAN